MERAKPQNTAGFTDENGNPVSSWAPDGKLNPKHPA